MAALRGHCTVRRPAGFSGRLLAKVPRGASCWVLAREPAGDARRGPVDAWLREERLLGSPLGFAPFALARGEPGPAAIAGRGWPGGRAQSVARFLF